MLKCTCCAASSRRPQASRQDHRFKLHSSRQTVLSKRSHLNFMNSLLQLPAVRPSRSSAPYLLPPNERNSRESKKSTVDSGPNEHKGEGPQDWLVNHRDIFPAPPSTSSVSPSLLPSPTSSSFVMLMKRDARSRASFRCPIHAAHQNHHSSTESRLI